jgi:hypothetical protein
MKILQYTVFISSSLGSTYGTAFVQSSVTPFIGRNKSVNPSLRLYEYNRDTGQVTDIFQYFLDFKEANEKKKAEWNLEYQATKEYKMPDLSGKSLKNLTESFKSDKSEHFKKYFTNLDVGYLKEDCDAECKKLQLCAIEKIDYSSYNACISKAKEFTADPEIVEVSVEEISTTPDAGDNLTSYMYLTNATTHSHHHHPMPIFIFYIVAALCALAIAFFLASAVICLRRKREPRYVRVVSLADMSAGYQ